MEVSAGPPPSARGVPVTRQRGAAAGRAHPAAAAPGPSRGEARRERRLTDPGARPGEAAGAEGAGAAPGGPWRARGACLRVWGWLREWVRGRAPEAVWALTAALAGPGWAVHTSWRRSRGWGCAGLCVHARVCVEGPPGVYLRMRWAVIVPAPGPGRWPAPAQSLLRGDVFQTGFLRRWVLLQPELEGGAPPPQASGDPGSPGTADRHLREKRGAHREGPRGLPAGRGQDGETEADG